MSDELNEELDSQNQSTEEVVNTEEVEVETPAEDTEDDVEALREKNKKLFERAKKAEAEAKELKTKVKAPEQKPQTVEKQTGDVTLKDQYALLEAKVPADDIDEVISYAKYKGISVAEALKTAVVKATLSERAEVRKTAEVAHTGGGKRTTVKLSDEALVNKAEQGDLPEDPDALVEARFNLKKNK